VIGKVLGKVICPGHHVLLLGKAVHNVTQKGKCVMTANILAIGISHVALIGHGLEVASPSFPQLGELAYEVVAGVGVTATITVAVPVIGRAIFGSGAGG